MVRERTIGRRPFKAVKGVNGFRVPAKLRNQDKDTARQKKCHHHLKLIHKALKKARQFEVGKLKRRLKAAAGADGAKLETQLLALGKVDLEATARQAAETCGVAEPTPPNAPAAAMPPEALLPVGGLQPALRVLSARLLAAKCVRDEVAAAQQSLAALDAAAVAQERRQQQIAQRQAERAQRKQDAAAAPSAAGGEQAAQQSSGDGDWDSMLGSGSESDDDAAAQAHKRQLLLSTTGPDAIAESAAASEQQQQQHDHQPPPGGMSNGRQPKAQKAPQKKPKNRLGQRARRKMAEQEFGGLAKHIATSSSRGWPAAHPAAALDPLGRATARPSSNPSSPLVPARHGASAARVAEAAAAAPAADAAQELHPSWAAKSAAKARLAAKPAGRKVVFSDEGDAVAAAEAAGNGAEQQRTAPGAAPRAGVVPGAAAQAGGAQQLRAPQAAGRVPGVLRHRDQHRASADGAPASGSRSSTKRPAAKLHPSWEAKAKLRKQMERLPAPAGIKVVFDDSE